MPRGKNFREPRREMWREHFRLADRHYSRYITPTEVFSKMYATNAAHWLTTGHPTRDVRDAAESWEYDAITENLVYRNTRSTLARILLRHPKVLVRPRPLATSRAERLRGQPPGVRHLGAAFVQQLENWRVTEFDFKRQVKRAQQDKYLRGICAIRHGYAAPEDVEYESRSGTIEFQHHQHIRPGWPFAVYQPLETMRFDPLARSLDEMQWVAFRELWILDDLKKFPNVLVPDELVPTIVAGMDEGDDTRLKVEAQSNSQVNKILGRVPVWEVWDRRTKQVFWWAPQLSREIGSQDWPLDWEGLPITMDLDATENDGIKPISEQGIVFELQLELNKLLSLVLVYAKRGVPLIVVSKSGMDEDEVRKIQDAEILEIVLSDRNPNDVLTMHNLQPVPITLIQSIQKLEETIREITGQGRIASGVRENVESGTEAAGIIAGLEARTEERRQELREFFARIVRKDFQVLQQTLQEDQWLDIVDVNKAPQLLKVSLEAIRDEYDFSIEVGSTEPVNERMERVNALQVAALLESPLAPFYNPAFIAQYVIEKFGLDPTLALAPQGAAEVQRTMDLFRELLGQKGQAAAGGGSATGAALDASKVAALPQQAPVDGGGGSANIAALLSELQG